MKGFRTPFLTLYNHFENRPSTILNFLEHLQLSHMAKNSHRTNFHDKIEKMRDNQADLMRGQPL